MLATVGFRPRDLRSVIRWQALAVVTLAVLVGVPLGLLLGRAAWTAVADATGVIDHVTVPVATLALVVVGTLLVGLAAGWIAGWAVTRIRPAVALHDE